VYIVSHLSRELGELMNNCAKELARANQAFSTLDLYEKAGLPVPSTVTESIEAVPANEEQADVLKMAPGDPILLITSLIYSAEGRPVEFKQAAYRGDQYSFHITRPIYMGQQFGT